MAQIKAKFGGTCSKCGQGFTAGTLIDWQKGRGSSHVTCPAKSDASTGNGSSSGSGKAAPAADLAAAPYFVWEKWSPCNGEAHRRRLAAVIGETRRYTLGPATHKVRGRTAPRPRQNYVDCEVCGALASVPCTPPAGTETALVSFYVEGEGHKDCPSCVLPVVPDHEAPIPDARRRERLPSVREGATASQAEPGVYVVAGTGKWHFQNAEDNEDMGDMQGANWSGALYLRLATADEAAPVLAAEAKDQAEREAERARKEAKRTLFDPKAGEYVERPDGGQLELDGTEIKWGEGRTIYGGGEWFVLVEAGELAGVWWVLNNGADGDDWSANNVHTGGAGAIGRRYEATPERLAFLRSLPGGDKIGLTKPEQRRAAVLAYHAQVAGASLRPGLAWLAEATPVDAVKPTPAVWVETVDGPAYNAAKIGTDLAATRIYVALSSAYDAPSPYEHDIYSDSGRRVFLEYEATPERIASVKDLWPSWVGTDAPGRYVLDVAFGTMTENAAEALREASWRLVSAEHVKVTPDVTVTFCSPGVVESHKNGVVLWSDGKLARMGSGLSFSSLARHDPRPEPYKSEQDAAYAAAGFPALPPAPAPTASMSETAVRLVRIASGQESWRKDRRFERLFSITSETRTQADHRARRTHSSSEEVTLYRLDVQHVEATAPAPTPATGELEATFGIEIDPALASAPDRALTLRQETLWLVHGEWGCMGEDGDAGDDDELYEDEGAARKAFKSMYARAAATAAE